MGVMLEAFCDLTDFDALAGFDTVQEVYAPWHALEEQSLSGRLLTNIFAGGTVDTEWGFLTGASEHDEYRGATGSYVRYFTAQGYAAHYAHPGYSWFYDRERVNDTSALNGAFSRKTASASWSTPTSPCGIPTNSSRTTCSPTSTRRTARPCSPSR